MNAGVAAVMRYTLRLLTTQQFGRAASMILACEAIRKKKVPSLSGPDELGSTPFSIGLWVGRDAVPNTVREAVSALNGAPDQPSPKQIVDCPACGETLRWFHEEATDEIQARCENSSCLLRSTASQIGNA
jgi:hypothetical protein